MEKCCVPPDFQPSWCCYGNGPIRVHERSDMDVHEQSAMGLDSRAVSDQVTKQRTSMLKACIFPKRLTKWGGIFKSINCEFLSCI